MRTEEEVSTLLDASVNQMKIAGYLYACAVRNNDVAAMQKRFQDFMMYSGEVDAYGCVLE
ncbi:TPA_asm: hypothetical protein vir530_00028 [dsDNA virus vir530]|jgi:hypothetical protein|nr:TPA_asm: hypothetical protein vir530_00028 [dsDNA virus vir530]